MADKPTSTNPFDSARLRAAVEHAVDGLIDLLDILDGDTDTEDHPVADSDSEPDDDGEPALGWAEIEARFGRYSLTDEFFGGGEDEPSMGWTASTVQDGADWLGGGDDREREHDGREPDADMEASHVRPETFDERGA